MDIRQTARSRTASLVRLTAAAFLLMIGVAVPSALAQETGGVLRAAMTTEPPDLDPYVGGTAANRNIGHHVFEGLVTYDETYGLMPQLAESWEISDDGLTYTFHLRSEVPFHDGSLLDAEDVKASLERFADIGYRSRDFELVTDISAPDERTVVITLSQPEGAFLSKLANPGVLIGIMPAEQAASRETLRPPDLIGTGPYRIDEWRPGELVRLVRFEDYASSELASSGLGGEKVAYLDEIVFMPVAEPGTRVAGLETGEYHFAEGIPTTSLGRIESSPDLRAHLVKPKWKIAVNFNHREGFFNNVTARRALLAALDMDEILSVVASGREEFFRAQPGLFFNEQGTWHTTVGGEVYNNQDQDLARQLFQEAGYEGQELVMATNRDFEWMYRTALAIQSQLAEVGVDLRLDVHDWAAQRDKTNQASGWDLGSDGKSMRLDPNDFNTAFLCESNSSYGYCNPAMDELVLAGASESDVAARQEIYADLQELMWEELPWLPVGDLFELEATNVSVQGYENWYTPRFWGVWLEQQ